MGAKIVGFLATMLLSVPLAAIGLMAVFGIPQLVPANSGPEREDERSNVLRGMRDVFQWGDRTKSEDSQATANLDDAPQFGAPSQNSWDSSAFPSRNQNSASDRSYVFENNSAPPRQRREEVAMQQSNNITRAPAGSPWNEAPSSAGEPRSNRPRAMHEPDQYHSDFNSNSATRSSALTDVQPAPNEPRTIDQGRILTWRQASLRLAELGIKNYHLERGAAEGTFLFVCLFSPGDAPHVVHRFEAEADDPLIAVNQVLQQVDKWMQTRFAASNFPTRKEAISQSPGTLRR